ncbi:hypothetical protein MUG91_G72n140 [Manis pentadactyla]|nr:hypothetical protein MUG91_G72n140 [Manis pentadactyla]
MTTLPTLGQFLSLSRDYASHPHSSGLLRFFYWYNKRPQEDYENICISKLEQCGFWCFIVPLEKERKEM